MKATIGTVVRSIVRLRNMQRYVATRRDLLEFYDVTSYSWNEYCVIDQFARKLESWHSSWDAALEKAEQLNKEKAA